MKYSYCCGPCGLKVEVVLWVVLTVVVVGMVVAVGVVRFWVVADVGNLFVVVFIVVVVGAVFTTAIVTNKYKVMFNLLRFDIL